MSGYPVQRAKVQPPPLRDDTLARPRLLDWLHAKVSHRLVFVVAEAGYGKTTLLADFSRRTRLRTLWYRLDAEDANWIAFLSHLVAAGREHDESFAPSTQAMLRDLTGGPTLEASIDTFAREFQSLGDGGAVVILDDYHIVDEAPDVRTVMRELLARAPDRVSFVIASRRVPSLPVARLRAQGEVAVLSTDDLRFSETETEQLFRESYHRPLEPDVLNDLSRRTEGWAASLQLVQAAIRNRNASEVRSFVRSLTGAEGDVYDYLAEEVISNLPAGAQHLLMYAAILESVVPEAIAIAAGARAEEATAACDAAQRAGLLLKRGRREPGGRFHPLVADFLQERARREVGPEGLQAAHRRIASYAADRDWRLSAKHFLEAGDGDGAARVIAAHLGTITSEGAYEEAVRLLRTTDGDATSPAASILRARVEIQRGRLDRAADLANEALAAAAADDAQQLAIATLLTVAVNSGQGELARDYVHRLLATATDPSLLAIAQATLRLIDISVDGDLQHFREELEALAERQRTSGQLHYLGVSLLNISDCLRVEGRFEESLRVSTEGADALTTTSSHMELAMVKSVRAWALAHVYGIEAAEADCQAALTIESSTWQLQVLAEVADIRGFYGDPEAAARTLEDVPLEALPASVARPLALARARALIRTNCSQQALEILAKLPAGSATATIAFEAALQTTKAMAAALLRRDDAADIAAAAANLARRQGAGLWHPVAAIARAFALPVDSFGHRVADILRRDPGFASMAAELFGQRLDVLPEEQFELVQAEARRRPARWRPVLRLAVASPSSDVARERAARLLEDTGDHSDIPRLRALARGTKRRSTPELGRALARRLAPRVFVEDLGRVTVLRGHDPIPGTAIRRKVLALACFLLTQPGATATRDQVLDALWPDQDPAQALNSLNQTLYFLRRVIEPDYVEDLSPGYIHHDAELVWLDSELVSSRGQRVRTFLQSLEPNPSPEAVDELTRLYTGRFALDFEYEPWADSYREWLHAAYLEAVESAIRADTNAGRFGEGIRIAQRALAVDPGAEQVELSLLRLYRQAGAHAAAAEQYERYADAYRANLGMDPPPLESL